MTTRLRGISTATLAVVAFASLATGARAQLDITTTVTEFVAEPSPPGGSFPAGTELSDFDFVTSGWTIPFGQGVASSSAQYQVTGHGTDARTIDCTTSCSVTNSTGACSPLHPDVSATVDVSTVLTSAEPMLVTVTASWLSRINGTGSVDLGGLVSLSPGQQSVTVTTLVHTVGFSIDTTASTSASCLGGVGASGIRLTIEPADVATAYGSSCNGATLSYAASLDESPVLTAIDPAGLFGVLLLGSQRIDIPLDQLVPYPWPCSLRTAIDFGVPLTFDAAGQYQVPFVVPPGVYTVQFLTSTGSDVNSSNGLEFVF